MEKKVREKEKLRKSLLYTEKVGGRRCLRGEDVFYSSVR